MLVAFGVTQAGMLFDIVGAGIMAWSLATTREADILRAANPPIVEIGDVEGIVLTRQDTLVGFGTLIAGFVLQFAASMVTVAEKLAVVAAVVLVGFWLQPPSPTRSTAAA
jgi:hypothetical protein